MRVSLEEMHRESLFLFQNFNPAELCSQTLVFIGCSRWGFLVTDSGIRTPPKYSDSHRSRVGFHQAIQVALMKLCISSETLKVKS